MMLEPTLSVMDTAVGNNGTCVILHIAAISERAEVAHSCARKIMQLCLVGQGRADAIVQQCVIKQQFARD